MKPIVPIFLTLVCLASAVLCNVETALAIPVSVPCKEIALCGQRGNQWCDLRDGAELLPSHVHQLRTIGIACNLSCVPSILLRTDDPFPPAIVFTRDLHPIVFAAPPHNGLFQFPACPYSLTWDWVPPFLHRVYRPCDATPKHEEAYSCDASFSKSVIVDRTDEVFLHGVLYQGTEASCVQWAVEALATIRACGVRSLVTTPPSA